MTDHATDNDTGKWDITIASARGRLSIDVKELWRYRDLLSMFVKKDIITVYKQTILGPIWFLLQPVFTTFIYVVIFGNVAKISTGSIPPVLFYLGSVTMWNYFSETLNVTSKTFSENASVFGKVYFPRLILPLSKVVSGLVKLMIQFGLFLVFWLYYPIQRITYLNFTSRFVKLSLKLSKTKHLLRPETVLTHPLIPFISALLALPKYWMMMTCLC